MLEWTNIITRIFLHYGSGHTAEICRTRREIGAYLRLCREDTEIFYVDVDWDCCCLLFASYRAYFRYPILPQHTVERVWALGGIGSGGIIV